MANEEIRDVAFGTNDDIYNKKIKPVPATTTEIGIDTSNSMLNHIIDGVESSQINMNALGTFTQASRSRNEIYETLDYMSEDSAIAAILETYAEDATETNDQGNIMWCESSDESVNKFVTYLLNALNVDKHIYKWAHSLCKYGDVYLRLYRESDYADELFSAKDKKRDTRSLTEDIKIKYYSPSDKYVHYLEYVDNPAQVFELTRFGKTYSYIKTDVVATNTMNSQMNATNSFLHKYSFNVGDIELYQPTEFVHGCLEDNSSRTPEEVEILLGEDKNGDGKTLNFKVKRGQSLLYNSYKIWRQLMLLENSVLLNRVTQSSIVRVIGVEVGDMPKENVQFQLQQVKQMIEQKAALNVGNSMSEYTNPGPVVNNVYIPTRNNQGVISTQQIGGEVKIGDLDDLSYYQNKFYGSMRVPKQYFSQTDDAAGFSGGESLALISSRYAKMVKRIQNVLCQMMTDAINLILIDTENESYINKFTLKMQPPATKEEKERRENIVNKVSLVTDIMNTLSDIESVPAKLKILKSLLSDTLTDPEVIAILGDEIDKLEREEQEALAEETSYDSDISGDDTSFDSGSSGSSSGGDFDFDAPLDLGGTDSSSADTDTGGEETSSDTLPSPDDLGVGDMSDMTNPNI